MSSSFLISSCSHRRFAYACSPSSRQRTAQARQLPTDLSLLPSVSRGSRSPPVNSPLTRHGHLFPVQCQPHGPSLRQHSSHVLPVLHDECNHPHLPSTLPISGPLGCRGAPSDRHGPREHPRPYRRGGGESKRPACFSPFHATPSCRTTVGASSSSTELGPAGSPWRVPVTGVPRCLHRCHECIPRGHECNSAAMDAGTDHHRSDCYSCRTGSSCSRACTPCVFQHCPQPSLHPSTRPCPRHACAGEPAVQPGPTPGCRPRPCCSGLSGRRRCTH